MPLTTRTKIALAATVQRPIVAVRQVFGRGPRCTVSRSGLRWALDLNEGIDFSIWLLGAFERSAVTAYSRIVGPGMTVLDIGANIGAHTLPLARLVGDAGRVIAVEPTVWALNRLDANIALNPDLSKRVLTRQVMLVGRPNDPVPDEIFASWPFRGGAVHPILRAQAKTSAGAQALTMDDLVRECGIDRVDFIKLDVDGHECSVLRGGVEVITRDNPAIVLELSPYSHSETGESFDEMLSILYRFRYQLRNLSTNVRLPVDATHLRSIIPDGGSINVLAVADPR